MERPATKHLAVFCAVAVLAYGSAFAEPGENVVIWHGVVQAKWNEDQAGVRHGMWNSFHAHGAPAIVGSYRHGREDGLWTFYSASGEPWIKRQMEDGTVSPSSKRNGNEPVGLEKWPPCPADSIRSVKAEPDTSSFLCVDGRKRKNGPAATWRTRNGLAVKFGYFVEGEQEGLWVYLDDDGRKGVEQRFRRGELHGIGIDTLFVAGKMFVHRYENGDEVP